MRPLLAGVSTDLAHASGGWIASRTAIIGMGAAHHCRQETRQAARPETQSQAKWIERRARLPAFSWATSDVKLIKGQFCDSPLSVSNICAPSGAIDGARRTLLPCPRRDHCLVTVIIDILGRKPLIDKVWVKRGCPLRSRSTLSAPPTVCGIQ